MKTLVFANQKGGVGKSAIACQMAYYYAARGLRILFVDLDHQMNSTRALAQNVKVVKTAFTAQAVLMGQASMLAKGDTFVLVPAEEGLSSLERQPANHQNYVDNLFEFARGRDDFDLCIIDTNPNPDIRYGAALAASDFVLSPIQLNQEALDGIGALLNHSRWGIHKLKNHIKTHELQLLGLLPNLVEPTPFQRGNFALLRESYSHLLIPIDGPSGFLRIPTRSAIAESQAHGTYLADVPKTAARDAFKEVRACFDVLAKRMALEI